MLVRRWRVALVAIAVAPVALAGQAQFRSAVDVVELNVAVRSGRSIPADLVAADFRVTDNGVPQPILSVTREALPIDVTLALDTSESLSEHLMRSLVNAANRVRGRLRPADRVSLVTFNQRIRERVALAAVDTVKAMPFGPPAGQTSLNDAIGVVLSARPVVDRRQMAIVFTDGIDSSSVLTEDDVLALAGRSATAIFVVSVGRGMAPISLGGGTTITAAPGPGPPQFFARIAAATGGLAQVVPPFRTIEDMSGRVSIVRNDNLLDESFLRALDDFRSSYVLRYHLTGVPRRGWHDVVVAVVKPGKTYQVRTRTGYIG